MSITWSLDRRPPQLSARLALDEQQQAVVDHQGGPLLVLAGPGTGKTATIVEAVVARLTSEADPTPASEVLVLTFGRRAAAELRTRIALRIGGGALPTISTFHSFAYSVMRAESEQSDFLNPPRLLSAPEQQSRIRELLLSGQADSSVTWPAEFHEAVATRGFAEQMRDLIATLRGLGRDPADLREFARANNNPALHAAAAFIDEYLQVSAFEGVLDYTEVLLQAAVAVSSHGLGGRAYQAVYIDEYQDTDPLQVRMIQGLVTPLTTLVAVGDPDQAIYSFRGADVGGILRFPDQFRTMTGEPARVVVLGHTRRFGPTIRAAATSIIDSAPNPLGLAASDVAALRNPSTDPAIPAGSVEPILFDDERSQAAYIADRLRRAALDDANPIAWSEMAVLVRSGTHQIPALRRALIAAGVPVEVAGDEVPLAQEPAVAVLLTAAEFVQAPDRVTPLAAQALITSPLGGVDPADLRRLVRHVRRRERAALLEVAARTGEVRERPRSSDDLVIEFLSDAELLESVPEGPLAETARAVARLADLLERARQSLDAGATPADVLWTLWSGTSWPRRLERSALGTGPGARRSNADLDAIVALFEHAQRAVSARAGFLGLRNFIDELQRQEIPASPLQESAVVSDAVRLLTAHRSKGLQWRLVVVAGVQEGSWPDTRRRNTLLSAEMLGLNEHGELEQTGPASHSALLAEERRLFYVACTRAKEALIVTAVASPDAESGLQPSRFLEELGVPARTQSPESGLDPLPVQRPLTFTALVSELRRVLIDPDESDELKNAAASRLSVLMRARSPEGARLVPAADPATWWAASDYTDPQIPIRPTNEPVALSGSGVAQINECSLRWFLDREARARGQNTTAIGFGNLVHAIADLVARGELPQDLEVLDSALGRVWHQLGFEASWHSAAERTQARDALDRFLRWHSSRARTLIGTEVAFVTPVVVDTPAGPVDVVLRGSMDVVEVEVTPTAARIHVADLKTGKVAKADVEQHVQLGVYQVAAASGAADEVLLAHVVDDLPVESGGSAIVALRQSGLKGDLGPRVYEQEALVFGAGPVWIDAPLSKAATVIRSEQFAAAPGDHCGFCDFATQCPAKAEGEQVIP